MRSVKRYRFTDKNGYPAIMLCDSVKCERYVEESEYDKLALALEAESKGSDRAAEAMLSWKRDFDKIKVKHDHLKQLLHNVRETLHFTPEDVLAIDAALREDGE